MLIKYSKEFRMFNIFVLLFLNLSMCHSEKPLYKAKKSSSLAKYDRQINAVSAIKCCAECERDRSCKSTGYRKTTKECYISYTPAFAALDESTDASSTVFAVDDWTLVFRGTPGIGTNPKVAWLGTGDVTSTDATCMSMSKTSCGHHYRNPVVDQWDSLRITEVKIAFYKDGTEKYIIFNGTDTQISDWFRKDRILSSSWSGMEQIVYAQFSIEGQDSRTFFTATYNGCEGDAIFTLVMTSRVWSCNYDNQPTFPQFLFATGDASGRPESMSGVAFADVFAIFVK